MAVDLFVMPLARYLSGDYVTPAMRLAWDLGAAYALITPNGTIELPTGQPLGGPGAGAERRKRVAAAPAFFDKLRPVIGGTTWDEGDEGEVGAWRPDTRSFEALLAQIDGELGRKPGLLGRVLGKKERTPHLVVAQVFLPAAFDTAFVDDGLPVGSLPVVMRELAAVRPSAAATAAHEVASEAAAEATRRCLPLIIDL